MATIKFQVLISIICVFLLIISWAPQAHAIEPSTDPVKVEVELFLIDLDGINDVDQNFVANLYLQASWHDPELAHEGSRDISRKLEDVWNPRLQIVNQQGVMRSFPESVDVSPEGQVTYRQRFWGTFSQPLDLADFPFDNQVLNIQVVAVGFDDNEVQLVPSSYSGVSSDYSITDWQVLDHSIELTSITLGTHGTPIPVLVMSLNVERYDGYYLVKIVLPMIMIVLMSMLVFWIDPEQSGTQIGVATTAMLTLIAYRFAVGANLPKLSFLTRLDYFILAATVLVFTSLIMVVWTSALARNGKSDVAHAIDRKARWSMPAIFLVLTVETLYFNVLN